MLLLDEEGAYEVCRGTLDPPFVVNRAELLLKNVREFGACFTEMSVNGARDPITAYIRLRSAPRGALPLPPLPFPESRSRVVSSSFLTSLANAACRVIRTSVFPVNHIVYLIRSPSLGLQSRVKNALIVHDTGRMAYTGSLYFIAGGRHRKREKTF